MTPTLQAAALLCLLGASAAMAQGSYRYGPDEKGVSDAVVSDTKSGLIWRRCSEGQSWHDGRCNGNASLMTYAQALSHTRTQTGWRIPNVKELSSLVDSTRSSPSIDTDAFPNTPGERHSYYWSSTPYQNNSMSAWFVGFGNGYVGGFFTNTSSYHLRLVR